MEKIDKRIEYIGEKGTIKYFGDLLHKPTNLKVSTNGIWAGIIWDSKLRGNHSGTVNNIKYFECPNSLKNGSLVKVDKLNFGVTLLEAFIRKYFKQTEINELLSDKVDIVTRLFTMIETINQELESFKNSKSISEYDEEAIINTSINFKKIEFVGWDKIWNQIRNITKIENLSLSDSQISSLGESGEIRRLFPSVKQLSIENNLIYSWTQIEELANELPRLEILWLCQNQLKTKEDIQTDQQSFDQRFNQTTVKKDTQNEVIKFESEAKVSDPLNIVLLKEPKIGSYFQNLKCVYLLDMNLNWKQFDKIKYLFSNVEEIALSQNKMTDFENYDITTADFPNIIKLDLAENGLKNSSDIGKLDSLKIKKLNLSKNELIDLGFSQKMENLTHLNVSDNKIADMKVIAEVSRFKSLTNLHIMNNPLLQYNDKSFIRILIIAGVPKIKSINGSLVDRPEKRDSEIYYLKNAFHEYFRFSNKTALTYDLEPFFAWARPKYPLIDLLIKRFDNPYPIEDRLYEAPPNTKETNEAKKFVNPQSSTTNKVFAIFQFVKNENGKEVDLLKKKLPITVDVGYLKTSVKNLLKIKRKIEKMVLILESSKITLENDMKKISDLTDISAEYKIALYLEGE